MHRTHSERLETFVRPTLIFFECLEGISRCYFDLFLAHARLPSAIRNDPNRSLWCLLLAPDAFRDATRVQPKRTRCFSLRHVAIRTTCGSSFRLLYGKMISFVSEPGRGRTMLRGCGKYLGVSDRCCLPRTHFETPVGCTPWARAASPMES